MDVSGRGEHDEVDGWVRQQLSVHPGGGAARAAISGRGTAVIETPSRKPCRIAQDEIKAGKVKWVIPEMPRSAAEVASEMLEKAIAKDVELLIADF